jgi:hypothetical protein
MRELSDVVTTPVEQTSEKPSLHNGIGTCT